MKYLLFTGVDLTGLQVGDPVIVDARGYLSFFVFFLFLEFKDEFRHDFLNTISSWYDKFIYVFKNHLDGTVFFLKMTLIWHMHGVADNTGRGYRYSLPR